MRPRLERITRRGALGQLTPGRGVCKKYLETLRLEDHILVLHPQYTHTSTRWNSPRTKFILQPEWSHMQQNVLF